jgi:hypothetical protein
VKPPIAPQAGRLTGTDLRNVSVANIPDSGEWIGRGAVPVHEEHQPAKLATFARRRHDEIMKKFFIYRSMRKMK